jgi:hypothetical protein
MSEWVVLWIDLKRCPVGQLLSTFNVDHKVAQ